ncbi:MAG: DUF2851 family protein [Verrucomicrobia bacterium]|nr:DUF2851 family protein [Verrucomicrobiota bacterium]
MGQLAAQTGERFSAKYGGFRDGPVLALRETGRMPRQGPRVPERLVACLWYSQRFLRDLKACDGRPVTVLSPGVWNLEEGPDFRRAAVRLGDEVLQGDVEIHVNVSDWTAHGHGKRIEYAGVALHVVMWNDTGATSVSTATGRQVPQVVLADALTQPLARVEKQLETDDYPYRKRAGLGECADLLRRVRRAELVRLIMLAGEWRIQEKAARYTDWLGEHDHDEVLYRAVMEALGYGANKAAMLALAERVPLDALRTFAEGQPGRAGEYAIQAALLEVSGLLPGGPGPGWDDESKRFHAFLRGIGGAFRDAHAVAAMDPAVWSTGGRPANSPARRIAAASLWLQRTRRQPLLATIASILDGLNNTAARFEDDYRLFRQNIVTRTRAMRGNAVTAACREARRRLVGLFQVGDDPYWSHRYVLGGRKLAKPVALLGASRLEEIVVNVVVPVLLLYVRRARPELEGALLMLFHATPKGADNAVTRQVRHRFFGIQADPIGPETAALRQGLHQLFRDFCAKDTGGCLGCPFRENLENWLHGDTIVREPSSESPR